MVEHQGTLDHSLVSGVRRRLVSISTTLLVYVLILGAFTLNSAVFFVAWGVAKGEYPSIANHLALGLVTSIGLGMLVIGFYFVVFLLAAYRYTKERVRRNAELDDNDRRIAYRQGHTEEFGVQRANIIALGYIIAGFGSASGWWLLMKALSAAVLASDDGGKVFGVLELNQLVDLTVAIASFWTNTGLQEAVKVIGVDTLVTGFIYGPPLIGLFIAFRYAEWLLRKIVRHENTSLTLIKGELRGFAKIVWELSKELFDGKLESEVTEFCLVLLLAFVLTLPYAVLIWLLLTS